MYNCADHMNIIQAEGELIWSDVNKSQTYRAKTGTLDAIVPRQTATIPELGKCKTAKLYFEEICATAVDPCDDTSCELTVNLTDDSFCVDYSIGECSQKNFSVAEPDYECTAFEMSQTIAKKMASARKAILEDMNLKYLNKINAIAGANNYVSPDTNIVNGATDTTIPSSYWGLSTFAPYINSVEEDNFSGVLLSGHKLNQQDYLSRMGVGSDDDRTLISSLGLEFDKKNVDAVLGGQGVYLINPNALAFTYYTENTARSMQEAMAQQGHNGTTSVLGWVETFTTDGGVSFDVDVYYQKKCIQRTKFSHTFEYVARWDMFNAPASICDGQTGVLKFLCA